MSAPVSAVGRRLAALIVPCIACLAPMTAPAQEPKVAPAMPAIAGAARNVADGVQPISRSGREIYVEFRDGLADQHCVDDASARWRRHFAHVPGELAQSPETLLPLFGYVVSALREYHLPTEYALIPFVESGYRPGARSASGPAGLWQFIAATARNHKIAIRPGYDGRLSPVESTRAAVRYLRTLHGMFAGDWRLAVMGYNAGEYRVFGALRNAGQQAMEADPDQLALPNMTQAYLRKLQALSCLLVEAGEREEWLDSLDTAVAVLTESPLPANTGHLDTWAARNGHDAALVRRFNPVFAEGRVGRADRNLRVLAPARPAYALALLRERSGSQPAQSTAAPTPDAPVVHLADASHLLGHDATHPPSPPTAADSRTHTVTRGDSIWRIARRYGVGSAQLLLRNGLNAGSVLRPGMVLRIDEPVGDDAPAVAH